jgi:hypothetical protein
MSGERPIGVRRAIDRRGSMSRLHAVDSIHGERDQERAAAQWLHAWSHDALRPTGELLVARLTNPAAVRPCRRIAQLVPGARRRPART